MKRFLKKIALFIIATFVLLFLLDIIYTTIYSTSIIRNKVEFVLNQSPKHYDVIFLGSSRAENFLMPEIFMNQGLSVYNLGMSGSNLFENSLLLKLFFEKGNTTDKILLQLDLNFQSEEPAEGVTALFLPYLPINNTIYNHYSEVNAINSLEYKYLPFYRYLSFDAKIGFREMIMTASNKESKFLKTNGFVPLEGELNRYNKYDLPKEANKKNKYYDQIKELCKINKVQLISFISPMCSHVRNGDFFSKLKQNVPELFDYSGIIKEDSLFASCGHLNEAGARIFTKILLKDHFSLQNKME